MGYTVGISSGWWHIGKDPNLLGLAQKAGGFGAISGTQFNQIDMESPAEFFEPRLKENIKRIQKELNVKIGLHGEVGLLSALESAERRIWNLAHERLVDAAKYCAEFGIVYINMHLSSTLQLQFEEAQKKPFGYQYQVVGPDGKSFPHLCEKSKHAKAEMMKYIDPRYSIDETIRKDYERQLTADAERFIKEDVDAFIKSREFEKFVEDLRNHYIARGLTGQALEDTIEREKANVIKDKTVEYKNKRSEEVWRKKHEPPPEDRYRLWKKSVFGQYFIDTGEIAAYMVTGAHMKGTGDPLWNNIVGSMSVQDAYIKKVPEFNAAIAARYIEGHLKRKDHQANQKLLGGMSILEWLQSKNIVLTFETPEVDRGHEALNRFYHLQHAYHFVKKMNSPCIKLTIDFEHVLANKMNPDIEIPKLPGDYGKYINLFHLGEPKPYWGTAHIPLPLGSQAQEIIYKWLYMLRKKGFRNGYIIFERGGGRTGKGQLPSEVFENSVWVMRQIVKYLEKDVKPDDLPQEFFGIAEENKAVWARQIVAVRDHAWDPLTGVLMIPDEKHTFLSRSAVEKGKREEWKKAAHR